VNEKLNDSDLPFHQFVVRQMQEAQLAQRQIAMLEQKVFQSQATSSSWMDFCRDKYKLSPAETIDEHGVIIRTPTVGTTE